MIIYHFVYCCQQLILFAEARMDEKFTSEDWEGGSSGSFLKIAEQDWTDWADPEEDIYEQDSSQRKPRRTQ